MFTLTQFNFYLKKSFNIKEMHILYTCNQWILKKPDTVTDVHEPETYLQYLQLEASVACNRKAGFRDFLYEPRLTFILVLWPFWHLTP